MNELQNIDKVTAEILILKQQTAQNIIEIGKRLTIVKSNLPFGEWGNYLKQKVDFTDRTAQKFIKVAEEFGKTNTYSDLPVSKLYALLDIPESEREDFIKENKVDEMTTRQLQQAIKEKKEADEKVRKLEEDKLNLETKVLKIEEDKHTLKKLLSEKPKEVEVEKEVVKEVIPKDYESLKSKVKELEEKEKLNQKEAAEYGRLKNQIEKLKDKKDDFNRKLQSISELSAKVDEFIKTNLAQIKYCRAVQEQSNNQIVQRNLKEIVNKMQKWCDDMYPILNSKIIDVEVNVNE